MGFKEGQFKKKTYQEICRECNIINEKFFMPLLHWKKTFVVETFNLFFFLHSEIKDTSTVWNRFFAIKNKT